MTGLALVTGASSGIGREYARRFGGQGLDLIVVARREERLTELAAEFPDITVRPFAADLSTPEGVQAVAEVAAAEPLTVLVNNAGVAHYKAFVDLTDAEATELVNIKTLAPTLITLAASRGMVERGAGTIINVAGMIAFSGPASLEQVGLRRSVYASGLAFAVVFSQTLHAELSPQGVQVQVVCPGVVATEFHERQGMDLSAVPRMSAPDVVTSSLKGLELGEVVTAPGVEQVDLLQAVFTADLAAFGGQSPKLAGRYQG